MAAALGCLGGSATRDPNAKHLFDAVKAGSAASVQVSMQAWRQ